jgi:1-acyl-sn-glycerol-3-phosphate acyltransferase
MLKLISSVFLKIMGWRINYNGLNPADFSRCVMLASPHTSNWDFPIARATFFMMNIPVRYTVKKSLTQFPIGLFMNPLGAIAINRAPKKEGEERQSMVEAMTDLFEGRTELVVLVTPEGTRSKVEKWKTGFYHVAKGAGVPIALGYLDYKKKEAGVGKIIHLSGDMNADMKQVMDFYRNISPKYPELFSVDESYK